MRTARASNEAPKSKKDKSKAVELDLENVVEGKRKTSCGGRLLMARVTAVSLPRIRPAPSASASLVTTDP
jgi:hypothetical protein